MPFGHFRTGQSARRKDLRNSGAPAPDAGDLGPPDKEDDLVDFGNHIGRGCQMDDTALDFDPTMVIPCGIDHHLSQYEGASCGRGRAAKRTKTSWTMSSALARSPAMTEANRTKGAHCARYISSIVAGAVIGEWAISS